MAHPGLKPHHQRYRLVTAAAVAIFLGLSLTTYLGAGRDDVFLTLWPGKSLAHGDGIVNYNGERVEISSSLLHTLLIAAIARNAPNYVFTLNKAAGLASGVLVLLLLHLHRPYLLRGLRRWKLSAHALIMFLVATNPSFLYWNLGGLETPFATLLITLYGLRLTAHWQRPRHNGLVLPALAACLFTITRPEGFYLILFGIMYMALFSWFRGWRNALLLPVIVPAMFFGAVTLWRWRYFDALFPNTVYAKGAALSDSLPSGLVYMKNFYTASPFLMCALGLLGLLAVYHAYVLYLSWRDPRDRPFLRRGLKHLFVFGLIVTVQLVVVLAGGDWMELFRFFVPSIPLLAALAVATTAPVLATLCRIVSAAGPRRVLTTFASLLALGAATSNALQDDVNIPRALPWPNVFNSKDYSLGYVLSGPGALDERMMRINNDHERELTLLEPFVSDVLPKLHRDHGPLVIATGQMGLFPYLLKTRCPEYDLYFVDHLGLCDRTVARLPMAKDCIGVRDGKYADEVVAGLVPHLSPYVRKHKPNLVYMLGYPPDMDERIERLSAAGYEMAYENWPEMIFLNPAP